jgi:hypothetical protein
VIERRTILKLGALGAAGLQVPLRAAHGAPGLGGAVIRRAVFDDRFAECRGFARELNFRGVVTTGIRGDVANLWYHDLRAWLGKGSRPIAGLTDRVALFCLEELARDVGMRVVFRVEHLIDRSGTVQHQASGPAPVIEAAQTLALEAGFGRAMADLVHRCHASEPVCLAAQKRTGPFAPEDKSALVSWVIA